MTGQFSEADKERVRRATDIVELVSRYVALRPSGKSFKGLCPFHNDKNPSFVVSPDRQTYYCFACHEGGDAFSFVMAQEKLEFPEAVAYLADRAGVRLTPRRTESSTGRRADGIPRERLYAANAWAADYFSLCLRTGGGQKAREYLARRGFEDKTVECWKLGYAPEGWGNLLSEAQRAVFTGAELLAAGLVVPREGGQGHYDRFRDRLIFPIFDTQERVIGFGARALSDREQPKYLNSPETALFDKSRALYGLHNARKSIGETGEAVIVEGYTDVLMAHQCGVCNVVATLGTALTREHVRVLRRYARQATVVFDADDAGQKASDRSLEVFVEESMPVRVAELPAGEDPCDTLLRGGADAFVESLGKALDLFECKVMQARRSCGDTPAERSAAIDRVLETLARMPNSVERSLTLDRVVKMVVKEFELAEERALRARLEARLRRMQMQGARGRPAQNSAGRTEAAPSGTASVRPECSLSALEREVLVIGLRCPELLPQIAENVQLGECRDQRSKRILEAMLALHKEGKAVNEAEVSARLEDRELSRLVVSMVANDPDGVPFERRLELCLERWRRERMENRVRVVRAELRGAQARGEGERVKELLAELTSLKFATEKVQSAPKPAAQKSERQTEQ